MDRQKKTTNAAVSKTTRIIMTHQINLFLSSFAGCWLKFSIDLIVYWVGVVVALSEASFIELITSTSAACASLIFLATFLTNIFTSLNDCLGSGLKNMASNFAFASESEFSASVILFFATSNFKFNSAVSLSWSANLSR